MSSRRENKNSFSDTDDTDASDVEIKDSSVRRGPWRHEAKLASVEVVDPYHYGKEICSGSSCTPMTGIMEKFTYKPACYKATERQHNVITTTVKIDKDTLEEVVTNFDGLKHQMRATTFEDPTYDLKGHLIRLLRKCPADGVLEQRYVQRYKHGRYLSERGLQQLVREVRNTICDGFIDIDITNCGAVILAFIAKSMGLDTKHINFYAKSRNDLIKKLNKVVPKPDGYYKNMFISVLGGGSTDDVRQIASKCSSNTKNILYGILSDIHLIRDKLETTTDFNNFSASTTKDRSNLVGKFQSVLVYNIESFIVGSLVRHLQTAFGITGIIMCFDGIMVDSTQIPDDIPGHADLVSYINAKIGEITGLAISYLTFVRKPVIGLDLNKISTEPVYRNRFDNSSSSCYTDYFNKYNCHLFSSHGELESVIRDSYHQYIVHIGANGGSYIMKDPHNKEGFNQFRNIGSSDVVLYYTSGEKTKKVRLSSYILTTNMSFSGIVCRMDNVNCKRDLFNIWPGFAVERKGFVTDVQEDGSTGLDMMLAFIREVWASGVEEHYKYIMSWLAGLFTNKDALNGIALVMTGPQGTGKNTLTDFLHMIIGEQVMLEISGIDPLVQKHNTAIINKRLIICNEMASTSDRFFSNFDKMKTLVTDRKIMVEPKGLPPYSIDNLVNFIIFSNHNDFLRVEESDRRYAIFKTSDSKRGDEAYFKQLRATCFNTRTAFAFYEFLLKFDAVSLRKIPMTDAKRDMTVLSKNTTEKFIEFCRETNKYTGRDIKDAWVPSVTLYEDYSLWGKGTGEHVVSATKFSLMLKQISPPIVSKRSNGTKYLFKYEAPEPDDQEDE
jgi:hypothetical protein